MNRPRKSAILCPNCRKLISADDPLCPYCRTRNPGSWLKSNPLVRQLDDTGRLIRTIIYVNIGMFVLSVLMNPFSMRLSPNPFTFFSPRLESLFLLGATGAVPVGELHRWWTLLSANYLHGGILHIAFNMIAFKQLSHVVAREYGGHRMFVLYTVGGVIGFWISYLVGVRITIGASAAVCSLMGALLYFGKSRGGAYGHAIYRQVGAWAVTIFIFGLLVPGINNWGHGGGIAGGGVLAFLLGYLEKRPERFLDKMLGVGCAVLTCAILAWAVLTGFYLRISG